MKGPESDKGKESRFAHLSHHCHQSETGVKALMGYEVVCALVRIHSYFCDGSIAFTQHSILSAQPLILLEDQCISLYDNAEDERTAISLPPALTSNYYKEIFGNQKYFQTDFKSSSLFSWNYLADFNMDMHS